jgi:hypothetical protein
VNRLILYLLLGVATEGFFGPFCYYFGAINPDGGANFLGLICMLVHFPVFVLATDYQLTATQQEIAALVVYPFLWAGFWFLAAWFFKRFRKKARSAPRVDPVVQAGQPSRIDFMSKQNPIPKVIALILVSFCAAYLMKSFDASALTKLDSMSAADYIQRERELHSHSYFFHFVIVLVMGGFYIGIIEFITYVIGLCFKKPAA